MLRYVELKEKPREFLAVTGLTNEEFQCLLPNFEQSYQKLSPPKPKSAKKQKQRAGGGGRKGQLSEMAEKLLFVLVYQKTAPLQTLHGLSFGLSQTQAGFWIHRLLPVLADALSEMGMKPERDGTKLAESVEAMEGGANLSLDGTERRIQRPLDEQKQREKYSGKKKTHTEKNLLLVNENTRRVVYLSETVEGEKHDKKLAEESRLSYPKNATLTKDTGFQGYEPEGVLTAQPKKR
jgi:hypothetical protein